MKVYVIGNGFSINLVKILENENLLEPGEVDFNNLFAKGDRIPGENGADCYLSKDNCPYLWKLGIRSVINSESATEIINNIISSYTLYVKKCKMRDEDISLEHPSVLTYFELNRYLKKLILFYDKLIVNALTKIDKAKWEKYRIPLINEISSNDLVISYNYDVLFERLIAMRGKHFSYSLNEKDANGIKIYKPHGSINFDCKANKRENIYNLESSEIQVIDYFEKILPMNFDNSLIIPPSGFVVGTERSWVANIRNGICYSLKNCCPTHITFFGLSYGLVDRDEINEILCHIDTESTQVIYINPNPAPSLDYILSQNYKKYAHKKP